MHMIDALVSPAVGGAMTVVSAGLAGYCVKKESTDSGMAPLMGVMGAFVFAAQMINFAIPGTGSSGHLGGGLLLAALLGPTAGFLTLTCVLIIQAFFFADGGLLTLGCNIFNMGFFTCFVAYPLIYARINSGHNSVRRIWIGSVAASVVGLQLGAFAVVLQTLISGKTELPFMAFAMLMQPIHLAIGVVEGLITASILSFIHSARPELLNTNALPKKQPMAIFAVILITATLLGGGLSLLSSSRPDGLEYSIESLSAAPEGGSAWHEAASGVQEKTALMPDYSSGGESGGISDGIPSGNLSGIPSKSLAGIVGGILTLCLTGLVALICFLARGRRNTADEAS